MNNLVSIGSFNSNYNIQKKNPSFGAKPQELKTLQNILRTKNPVAGKILDHLINSTQKNVHPWTKLFLKEKPADFIQKFVEIMAKHRGIKVLEDSDKFRIFRNKAKKLESRLNIIGDTDFLTKKSFLLDKLAIKKANMVKSYMPTEYKGDLATSTRIMEKANPLQMGKIKFNRYIHELIYSKFYKPKK